MTIKKESIPEKIQEELDYSLSENDIREVINKQNPTVRYKIVSYDFINRFNSIDKLMCNLDALIILYKTEPSYGHWVCLTKCNTEEYHKYIKKQYGKESDLPIYCWFDPLGMLVDNELDFVDEKMKTILHEKFPHLRKLLKECPNIVEWNETHLQTNFSNTCGRFTSQRVVMYQMPLKEFVKLLS